MKHVKNAAIVNFKAQVDRMAEFLKAAGYEFKRTHLVEASARFQGASDWRTLRAEMENRPVKPKMPVPDLGGKSVRVYMDAHSCGMLGESPPFCWTDISQGWVDRVLSLSAFCVDKSVDFVDDGCEVPDWMDDEGTFGIQGDGIRVGAKQFWYRGLPKHHDDAIETPIFSIDKVIQLVKDSKRAELYLFSDKGTVDWLMEQLGRDENDANFVSSTDIDCVPLPEQFN